MDEIKQTVVAPEIQPLDRSTPETQVATGEPPIVSETPTIAPTSPEMPEVVPPDEWNKVRQLALRQLDRFMSLEPKVLQGDDPDAIHDIRVASRRLQQVLDLLYPPPPPQEVRALRRKLRRSRRALSMVRNCDVLLARVETILRRKRAAHREAWESLRHYLRERRSESFQKAARKLGKVNFAVFYVRLKGLLVPGPAASYTAHHARFLASLEEPTTAQFYQRIDAELERVWNRFETQIAQSHLDPRPAVIHGARIAAKRFRYLIEVLHAFDVSGSEARLAWLRRLQQHLGDWHDLEVLEQMMIEMVARPEFLRNHLKLAMEIERLVEKNRRTKQVFQDKFFEMTKADEEMRSIGKWVDYVRSSPSAAFAIA